MGRLKVDQKKYSNNFKYTCNSINFCIIIIIENTSLIRPINIIIRLDKYIYTKTIFYHHILSIFQYRHLKVLYRLNLLTISLSQHLSGSFDDNFKTLWGFLV